MTSPRAVRHTPWTIITVVAGLAMYSVTGIACGAENVSRRPNVILIMTDNHGPWTLGCYGNREIRTPHIDRLAKQGTLFTHCYSSNAVCSPTRATFLTGLLPSQHGVHCYLRAGNAQTGPKAYSTIAEFRTLPEILHEAGYVCGLSGKWHLGLNMKPQEGFSFWVTKPHGHTLEFYDQPIIENGKIHAEASYQTEYWTTRGIEFIQANKDKPFFLFLAYNGPYGLGPSLLNPPRNRHREHYGDMSLESFPREQIHPWLFRNRDYINKPTAMRRYAAEVSGVDDGVGRVMETLRDLNLDDNTLVIFTADQGLAGGHSGFWGMGDHTRPLTAFDWTTHIPLIFYHPKKIAAAQRSEIQISNYDFLPTLLQYLDLAKQGPAPEKSPGRDFSAVLRGKSIEWDDVTFYEFENVRSIRTPRWKYIERIGQKPNELYDLIADPSESKNLIERSQYKAIVDDLHERLQAFFAKYADPKYDLWNGGASKSHLINAALFGKLNAAK